MCLWGLVGSRINWRKLKKKPAGLRDVHATEKVLVRESESEPSYCTTTTKAIEMLITNLTGCFVVFVGVIILIGATGKMRLPVLN